MQFPDGEGVDSLGLTGEEVIDVQGLEQAPAAGSAEARKVSVTASARRGPTRWSSRPLRGSTRPTRSDYYMNGGILLRVLRDLR